MGLNDNLESWQEMIDKYDDKIIACTISDEELKKEFDSGFGIPEGKPFVAWSKDWVYFCECYDGAESVNRLPRNPCDYEAEHIGGW